MENYNTNTSFYRETANGKKTIKGLIFSTVDY